MNHQGKASAGENPGLELFQGGHLRIESLFCQYQCGLMSLDLVEAGAALASMKYELAVHTAVEEQVLLPIFEGLGEPIEGAAPSFFIAEHDKLDRLLGGLCEGLGSLVELQASGGLSRAGALLLIEKGFTFKHLFEHHSSREDRALYPAIGASLSSEARARTWKRMDQVEKATRSKLGHPPGESGESDSR
jgi:hypothetical protein